MRTGKIESTSGPRLRFFPSGFRRRCLNRSSGFQTDQIVHYSCYTTWRGSVEQPKAATHPFGRDSARELLPAAGLTHDELAHLLGVSRTVSEILHERRPVTTDMAHRSARAFGTSPEMWLGLQQEVYLWEIFSKKCSKSLHHSVYNSAHHCC